MASAVQVHDPMASPEEALREYGVRLLPRERLEPAEVGDLRRRA